MKPILFNTDMVRAILEGRKTVTRRVIKPMCSVDIPNDAKFFVSPHSGVVYWDGIDRQLTINGKLVFSPYRHGDILYVRETWAVQENLWNGMDSVIYRANCCDTYASSIKWRPSIHMPREAARIFLRVTDVRVERLRDITEEQAQAEGVKGWMVATDRDWDKNPNYLIAFRNLWDSTIKKADRALYGWEANPWVWVIEFERCGKPKGD